MSRLRVCFQDIQVSQRRSSVTSVSVMMRVLYGSRRFYFVLHFVPDQCCRQHINSCTNDSWMPCEYLIDRFRLRYHRRSGVWYTIVELVSCCCKILNAEIYQVVLNVRNL
jgi:hypothetical protein